jgi:hypothetical protein
MSFPSTPLRLCVSSPSPRFQRLSRVYSAPYTGSWVEQELSSSPSPLSKVPPIPGCGPSPPILKLEGTPFDRHFNLSQPWSSSSPDMSPIARKTSDGNPTYSPREGKNSCHRFSGGSDLASPWLPMGKLPCLNSSESRTFSPDCTSSPAMHASGLSWSPVSSLSTLTSLSSPDRSISDDVPDAQSCTLPTRSPIFGWNPTTDRYANDINELEFTPRDSLCTASRLVPVRNRKRALPEDHDEELPAGRTKCARTIGPNVVGLTSQTLATLPGIPSQRRLPPEISPHPGFPLLYRRYPISSFLQLDDEA